MKSTATKLAIIFSLLSVTQAEDQIATLGELSLDQNGVFIGALLENLSAKAIYTSSPRRIFLQHKFEGEWVDTPYLRLVGHTGTEQHIKIESDASKKVGVDKRLYQSLVYEKYRLKVVFFDPDTGNPAGSLLSRPATLKSGSEQAGLR